MAYLLAAAAFLVAFVLSLFSGRIAAATGLPVTVVRSALLLLGVAAAAAAIAFKDKINARFGKVGGPSRGKGGSAGTSALDDLLREAETKLAASSRSGAKDLRSLPVLYVLGEPGSAKTTTVLKSTLEPELLAGQIYRDKDVIPTPAANIWFTDKCVLIEAGEAFRKDPALWLRLIARTRPSSAKSAFGAGAPFRAAIVCVALESLLGTPNTETLQAAAAPTGERLRQLATGLGTELPTYVLLTKLDRVQGFAEFVRNVSFEEGNELLGAAPAPVSASSGYAEKATASISAAFDAVTLDLSSARLDLLARETDTSRLGLAYEFPRELRKLRNGLTSYLVELVRPSQLSTNPLLRAFCFTGVRAQLRQASAAAAATRPAASAAFDSGATGVFASLPSAAAAPQQPAFAPAAVTEKVAQWTFLPRFFPQVVLGDTSALQNTQRNTGGAFFKRLLYGSLATLLLLYLALLTVSYFHNKVLEGDLLSASNALAVSPAPSSAPASPLASADQLILLDSLRVHLAQLEDWRENGAPLSYRWGLYSGERLLAPARAAYFAHFRTLLLNRTEANLLANLDALPASPPQGADYNLTYGALRGYLITTNHAEKSTSAFLTPVLLHFWQSGASASPQLTDLARTQFDFYAAELPRHNPYDLQPVGTSVTHARTYLASFGSTERIYQSMLTAAEKTGPAINFNATHPRSAETVVEPHIIQPAFTKPGYAFMQNALAHPDTYFSGEAWVLGDQAPPSIDLGPVRQQLSARYLADFLAQWRAFVKDAQVVHYGNLKDAGAKLTVLSGNNSPLLALLATVSQNTAVANPEIASAFQAPQALVPGTAADVLIGPSNKSYVDALLALNNAIGQVAGNPSGAADPTAAMPISAAASAAHLAAQQSAQAFHIDPAAHMDTTTLALMEAPITSADSLVHGIGPAAANAGGKSFCAAYTALFSKVPFSPNAAIQATPAEVAAIFQPGTGSLWQFYNSNLKAMLIQQGADYVQAPNAPMTVNPAFAHFFSRAAQLSNTLFPPGAAAPSLTFLLRNLPSNGIQSSAFKVDAQTLNNTDTGKQFNWTANPAGTASLTANNLPLSFSGPWAVFQLVGKAKAQKAAGAYDLSFALEVANTPVKGPDGTPVVAHFELSGPGADVLAPGGMSGLHCVSTVANK